MHVVIDIDDNLYTRLFDNGKIDAMDMLKVCTVVRKGTPLPKGHGDLIAEPTEKEIAETIGGNNGFAECIREAVKAVFDNAQTVIPADKEVD